MIEEIDTDNSSSIDENVVDEPTAASGFGNPSLDADRIDNDTDAQIDALLDESIRDTTEDSQVEPAEERQEPVRQAEPEPEVQAQPATPAPQAPELDPEIASIEQPRNLSEKNQNNWRKLQETASTYKKQAAEAELLKQRLIELESNKAVQLPEDYEDLKKFRAIFDIKNDSEFKSRYEQPISSAKENIYNILRKHGASEEVINSIEQAGGPEKVDQAWWKNNAIDKLPLTDAERLKRNLVDVIDLKEKQDQEIEFAAQNVDKYLEAKELGTVQWYDSEVYKIDQHMDQVTKELPWARFLQPTDKSTPEEIERIQQHNQRVGVLAEKFNTALWPQTAEERANIAAAAVFSHVLTDQLRIDQQRADELMKQVKKLTEENSKLKGASRMPRSNAAHGTAPKSSTLNDRIKMSAMDAIDLGLDEAGS
jgi:hypothetical protein